MEEHGLNPEDIIPTGPQGIILKGDVLEAIAGGGQKQKSMPEKQSKSESKAQPQPKGVGESQSKAPPPKEAKEHSDRQLEASKAGPAKASQPPSGGNAGSRKGKGPRHTDIPNSQIRKIIAQRLLESKQQIPSLYVSATADVDAVSALRQSLKEHGKKGSLLLPSLHHVVKTIPNLPQPPCTPEMQCASSYGMQQLRVHMHQCMYTSGVHGRCVQCCLLCFANHYKEHMLMTRHAWSAGIDK